MKNCLLTISLIVSTLTCFGQSLFFDNLDNSTWTSAADISDSIQYLEQIPLSKLIYSKDSINEDVSIWIFRDHILTIMNYSYQKRSEQLAGIYKYEILQDKSILQITTSNNQELTYKAGITSTGYYAVLLRTKKTKSKNN